MNFQNIIKKPYAYILVRWSSDHHQLLYTEEGVNGILMLERKTIHNGISITDVMRILKRDNQTAQFESEQEQNGDYCC